MSQGCPWAEVIVSPSTKASDRALTQTVERLLVVGHCFCHSHPLRAAGTEQACEGEGIKRKQRKRTRRLEMINSNRNNTKMQLSPQTVPLVPTASAPQRSRLRIHSCSENSEKLMNYLSLLRSILQRAVSQESKPQQGRQGREQLPPSPVAGGSIGLCAALCLFPSTSRPHPHLVSIPVPVPMQPQCPHTSPTSELLPRS